jgi:hypothetical protein
LHLGLSGDLESQPRPAVDVLGRRGAETLEDAERSLLARALARAAFKVILLDQPLARPRRFWATIAWPPG